VMCSSKIILWMILSVYGLLSLFNKIALAILLITEVMCSL
jgi:hypothetical protein